MCCTGENIECKPADLTITRFCIGPLGTFGKMTVDGATLYTVERPWLNNQPNISCIPDGKYLCRPRRFFRGGYDAVEITDVPGRTHILFHIANKPTSVEGCIGVNSYLGCLGNTWAGLGSRIAFEKFMDQYGHQEFVLEITSDVSASLTYI